MATWDGSHHNSEDPNYFLYAGQNTGSSGSPDWPPVPGLRSNSSFLPDVNSQSDARTYNRNGSNAFYRVTPETSAADLGNAYPRQITSDTMNGVNALPDGRCDRQDTIPISRLHYYCRNGIGHNTEVRDNTAERSSMVERSNLHATASEFIPNSMKSEKGESEAGSGSKSDIPCIDDKNRHSRKYNSRKNADYKQNSYRTQNTKSYSKLQSDRYFNDRPYPPKLYKGTSISDTASVEDAGVSEENSQTNFSEDGVPRRHPKYNTTTGRIKRVSAVEVNGTVSTGFSTSDRQRRYNASYNELNYHDRNPDIDRSNVSNKTMQHKHSTNNKMDRWNNYRDNSGYRGKRSVVHGSYDEHFGKECKGARFRDKDNYSDVTKEQEDKDVISWRQKPENTNRFVQKNRQRKKHELDDDASQRERLTDQLNKGQLECLVCCDFVRQLDYVWSCSNCYHVLHLKCVKKWAKSSLTDNGWRCPACQNVNTAIPEEYFCFCGKMKTPEWNRRDTAHSCGETCGRARSTNNCVHKCTLLCHPGACPPCIATVSKQCGCGRTSQTVQCSAPTLLCCDSICGKELNCKKHTCEQTCHYGECAPCGKLLRQECYCGKNSREVECLPGRTSVYSCEGDCGKLLDCRNHECKKVCHPPPCEPCPLTPEKVTTCCCGQTPLKEKRETCLDPISVCDKVCSKPLKCGQPNNSHACTANCHQGSCPDCELTTDVKCRCGNMDREVACKDLTSKADDARCEKRCPKKRSCGRHKCNQLCCIDLEHICPLPCSKTLSCGRHKCEQSCHRGRCQACWRSSFDELYCECGAAVIYPPVPCGTRKPPCSEPCSREHPCGHQVLHNCHSEPTCPPCTVLTQKWCYGKHELRKAVPCYVDELSCGLPCNKPLSCGRHKCITVCHPGPCERQGQQCGQPCTVPRELCGHICAAPCHEGKCPDTPCKEMVKVTCQCGHRSTTRVCAENSREYQRIASNILASKMADMQLGHSVDLEEVFGQCAKKQNQLKTLECNDECKLIERNRRLALGLQIVNPDLSGKLTPRYSDFMKQWAKKDPHFCQTVHEKLTELVQLAKTSKQKSRSYSFEIMNRDKRHFVHEACEHFGCESQAYDLEPKRNVVATAVKDKCWLPGYSLLEIVQRENGQRKVPGPIHLNASSKGATSVKTVLSLPAKRTQKPSPTPTPSRSLGPDIDYFEYHG